MFFKGGRAIVFGRRMTYATFAVLAAAFMVAAVLVAAPAWSQDTQTKEDTPSPKEAKTGDTKTPEKPAQAENKESGSGDAGQAAAEKNTTQTQKKESVSKAA